MKTTFLPLAALFSGVFLYLTAGGLQGILLPVRAQIEGFPAISIGVMGAMFSVGFVAGCFIVPRILSRVGHIRTYSVMASFGAFVVLLVGLWVDMVGWIVLRAATGFCFAGGAMIVESWLNERATNETRGSIMSAYMVVNLAAITVGQMSLALADPRTTTLFMVCAMLFALALVPTALSTGPTPQALSPPKVRLRRLYRISPVGVFGCFSVGLGNGAFGTLGAVYAQQQGMSAAEAATFMSAAVIGGALAQYPIGKLSDRTDRRYVLLAVAVGAVLTAIGFLNWPDPTVILLFGLAFIYGAMVNTMYSLAVAHANDFVAKDEFVETSSGLLMVFGLGAILGPIAASIVMAWLGRDGLFVSLVVIYTLLCCFTILRMRQRSAPPPDEREEFQALPRSSTPVIHDLDPRSPDAEPDSTAGEIASRP